MISLIFALSLTMSSEVLANPEEAYRISLSVTAREEMNLVEKMRNLRSLVEKLPGGWKASGIKSPVAVTKESLLTEVEQMELTAADRWTILLNNTAHLDQISDPSAFEARRALQNIPKAQAELSRQIEEVNFKIKDGVLLNLASKVMLH